MKTAATHPGADPGSDPAARRAVILTLASLPALAWTGAAFGQSKKPPVVIGWLGANSSELGKRNMAPFKEGLAALGWKEGAQFVIEGRWGDGRVERLPALAAELKQKNPSVIVTYLTDATRAAAKVAPEIPIVQALGNPPVDLGLAKSLAHPGGMVTGLTNLTAEISTKYLELLLAAAPRLKRVGFLISTGQYRDTHLKSAHRALEHYRIEGRFEDVARAEDLELAVARLAKEGVHGLVLMPSNWLTVERARVVKLALAQHWPVVAGPQTFAEEGALISYSADGSTLSRRAAYYVDRILKGTKPGDLPIEQPLTFLLTVNLKTAKALGLTMPPEIMVRATRVIE